MDTTTHDCQSEGDDDAAASPHGSLYHFKMILSVILTSTCFAYIVYNITMNTSTLAVIHPGVLLLLLFLAYMALFYCEGLNHLTRRLFSLRLNMNIIYT
jgi:hypothetical protein